MLGAQSDSKNNQEKFNFEKNDPNKIKFMTVMNILNEGVHMDNIDGIIWLRPLDKNSKILFLQQFGRIIHGVEPNKKLSDVINEEKSYIYIEVKGSVKNHNGNDKPNGHKSFELIDISK